MTVTINLPDEFLSSLHQERADTEKDIRLAVAIEWYRRGALSQGKAAEVAEVPLADFLDELAARRIDVVEVDLEELRRELGVG